MNDRQNLLDEIEWNYFIEIINELIAVRVFVEHYQLKEANFHCSEP